MYDHDPDELAVLGWEEFITRQWESIFAGYRSWTGLRRIGRRWSDLIEAGLGCSQEIADRLVRAEVIDRADRDLEITADAGALVRAMARVVADLRLDLAEMAGDGELTAEAAAALLDAHARLLAHIRSYALGPEDPEYA